MRIAPPADTHPVKCPNRSNVPGKSFAYTRRVVSGLAWPAALATSAGLASHAYNNHVQNTCRREWNVQALHFSFIALPSRRRRVWVTIGQPAASHAGSNRRA